MVDRICEMEATQRPRERLLVYGPASLSDAELLAILLRTGRHGRGAVGLAHDLLAVCGGLGEVARLDAAELCARPGIGPVKAATVVAALELARRLATAGMRQGERLDDPETVGSYLARLLGHERREVFGFLSLDGRHRLIRHHELTRGTRTQAPVDPADLFRTALLDQATGVVVFHNHPSGAVEPSRDDLQLTRRLVVAGETVGIRVLDHLVVAGQTWVSLRRRRGDLFRTPLAAGG